MSASVCETRYLLVFPRNFSNEWWIYRVSPDEAHAATRLIADIDPYQGSYEWIDEIRAMRMLSRASRSTEFFGGARLERIPPEYDEAPDEYHGYPI